MNAFLLISPVPFGAIFSITWSHFDSSRSRSLERTPRRIVFTSFVFPSFFPISKASMTIVWGTRALIVSSTFSGYENLPVVMMGGNIFCSFTIIVPPGLR